MSQRRLGPFAALLALATFVHCDKARDEPPPAPVPESPAPAAEPATPPPGPDATTLPDAIAETGLDAATPEDAGPAAPIASPRDAGRTPPVRVPDAGTPVTTRVAGPIDGGPPEPPDAAYQATEAEDIAAATAALRPLVSRCFFEAEKLFYGAHRVSVRVTLDADKAEGRFRNWELVENSLRDGKSFACFTRALRAARFQRPTGGLGRTATLPFSHVPTASPRSNP
jgi:hypothetical protein